MVEGAGGTSSDTVATDREAIEAADVHRPDIILSGLELAGGSGPVVVRAIHKRHGRMPVIFITGQALSLCSLDLPGVVPGKPIDKRHVAAVFRALTEG